MFTYSSDTIDEIKPHAGFGSFSNDFTLLSCNPLEIVDLIIDFEFLFSVLLLTDCFELHLLLNLEIKND